MSKNRTKKQSTEPTKEEDILLTGESVPEVKEEKPKKLIGYCPVTSKEVYE